MTSRIAGLESLMSGRVVIFDTETTGVNTQGDRVVEIGMAEMVDFNLTGRTLHRYINPQRASDPRALAIHGLTTEFLADKPLFKAVATEILLFLGRSPVVAHNAGFDVDMLNAELERCGQPVLRNQVIDSIPVFKRLHRSTAAMTLDGVMRRYNVTADRTLHGALKDTMLLAECLVRAVDACRDILDGIGQVAPGSVSAEALDRVHEEKPEQVRLGWATDTERLTHAAFIERSVKNAVWLEGRP